MSADLKSDTVNPSVFISNLDSTAEKGYSLWKIIKKIGKTVNHQAPLKKPDGTRTKHDADKSIELRTHLKSAFTPNLADPLYETMHYKLIHLKRMSSDGPTYL